MNFPFIHIFWIGFAVAFIATVVTKHVCDAFNIITEDKDSPEWDSR